MARTAKKAAKRAAPKKKAAPRRAIRAATRKIITPPGAPARTVPISAAVKVGNLIFVSGTTPFDRDGNIARGDFGAQMHQVMTNIKAILIPAGYEGGPCRRTNCGIGVGLRETHALARYSINV